MESINSLISSDSENSVHSNYQPENNLRNKKRKDSCSNSLIAVLQSK